MKQYLKNVIKLFVKHYVERRNVYVGLALAIFGLPLLVAVLTKSSLELLAMFPTLFTVSLAVVLYVSTIDLRSRMTYVLTNALPVSYGERYGFILLNSTVVWFVGSMFFYLSSLFIATMIYPIDEEFRWVVEVVFRDPQTYRTLFGMQAVMFIANVATRRRLALNYLLALVGVVVVQFLIVEYVDPSNHKEFKMWLNIVFAIVVWVSGYFILKAKRLMIR